jgi:hypothetical protein
MPPHQIRRIIYDYRLWIELSESTEESDCGRLDAKAEDLQKLVDEKLNCKPHQCIFDLNRTKSSSVPVRGWRDALGAIAESAR